MIVLERLVSNLYKIEVGEPVPIGRDRAPTICVLVSGYAIRYKLTSDGRRQIVAYLIPGDIFDTNALFRRSTDSSFAAITSVKIARASCDHASYLLQYAGIRRALRSAAIIDEAILREWVTNLGQRTAEGRIAHFVCELFMRMKIVGLTEDVEFDFPLTQVDLADALGMSTVHVNRTLQSLKAAGILVIRRKRIAIKNLNRLEKIAGFRAEYLEAQVDEVNDLKVQFETLARRTSDLERLAN